jgi:16S rRNA (guanine527-N7)-methyltransferase
MFRKLLFAEFRSFAKLSDDQLDRFEQHYNLLVRWNQRLNLTRIADVSDAVRFHYCESLYLGLKLPSGPLRIADVGSGAGFRGIPVAVLRPELQVVLIEAHQRKAVFLREAVREVRNARVLSFRAGEVGEVGERFDWVVSRAVSPKEVLATHLAPNYALLVGSKDAPVRSEILRSPWGEDRILAVSRGTVSRETTP